jgi:hypothetical protein
MSRLAVFLFFVFCTSAYASDADRFVQSSTVRFKSLLVEMSAASVVFSAKLSLGECAAPDERTFEQKLKNYQDFESEAVGQAKVKFNGRDPASEYVQREIVSTHNAWQTALSGSRTIQAKAALDGNCLDAADRFYRAVVDLDASPHDVRLALVGIEDIRQRRRKIQPTESLFLERWWKGK